MILPRFNCIYNIEVKQYINIEQLTSCWSNVIGYGKQLPPGESTAHWANENDLLIVCVYIIIFQMICKHFILFSLFTIVKSTYEFTMACVAYK